jgi:hypothetical protein
VGKLMAKDQAEARDPIPAKTYFGIVAHVIDLGTQDSTLYGPDHKINIGYELHTKKGPALDPKGNQYVASKEYALKFSKIPNKTPAGLRVAVENILGREFSEEEARAGYDLEQLLGLPCKVQIKHTTKDGKTYDEIAALLPLDEDDDRPTAALDHVYYELDPEGPIPDDVPKWIAKKIQKSHEWLAANGGAGAASKPKAKVGAGGGGADPDDDDIPF